MTAVDRKVLTLGPVEVTVALAAGPRILGYARPGRRQLFAELPDVVIRRPDVGTFRFLGGHRLWRAPEEPAVTYQPDDHGVVVERRDGGVGLVGAPDRDGLVKTITVRQHGELTAVDHTLRNDGAAPVAVAPWAITQLVTGGTAILPQPAADPEGLLPDRQLVFWPYTDPAAPEVLLRRGDVRVHASFRPSRTKLGQANRRGWLAYHLEDQLFVKWAPLHDDGRPYVDLGSSVEVYRDERFCELESLGAHVTLAPGGEVAHREVWTLLDVPAQRLDAVLDALPDVPELPPAA